MPFSTLSHRLTLIAVLALAAAPGCRNAPGPATPQSNQAPPESSRSSTAEAGARAAQRGCDATQSRIAADADRRVRQTSRTGHGFTEHLAINFPEHRVSWLMREDLFQKYIVEAKAPRFGRCEGGACYLFVAPLATIRKAVAASMKDGKHDAALLGAALGLPAKSFEGPLRMMTLDLDATAVCARLPVDADPGVWKCKDAADRDCFQFGGYTSGGLPEAMIVDAPVVGTATEAVP